MEDRLTARRIRDRITRAHRRLIKAQSDPRNADRALWGAFALFNFADVTGQSKYAEADPETVLGDLLADLMHWCDAQASNVRREQPLDFESALARARNHYAQECADEFDELHRADDTTA